MRPCGAVAAISESAAGESAAWPSPSATRAENISPNVEQNAKAAFAALQQARLTAITNVRRERSATDPKASAATANTSTKAEPCNSPIWKSLRRRSALSAGAARAIR
nr:hypothetical protein [Chenggangzhangella methanolivorans]